MESIIIDGCNVAECIELHIREGYAENCNLTNCPCWQNPNCYFKQLQRAKAEKQEWVLKCAECESRLVEVENKLEQYKKSKQASYENMQEQWNNAVNENRLLKAALKNKNFVAIAEENERLKNRNKLYKKIIKENIEKANNNFMILTACIQGNLSIDDVKEYTKLNVKKDELKRKLKSYKQALEEVEKYCNECNLKADYTACEVLRIIDEGLKCRH